MPKLVDLFMHEALKEAQKAFDKDEVPVGCVIVHQGKIIGRGHNQVESLKDPTAHAEMIALTSVCASLATKWLNGVSVYVTIEPCSMCAGALVLARVKNLIYGADDPKTGACGSITNLVNNKKLNHRIKVKKGVLKDDCGDLLREFFKKKRKKAV
jgi:tRNA(adenine34) deaminase